MEKPKEKEEHAQYLTGEEVSSNPSKATSFPGVQAVEILSLGIFELEYLLPFRTGLHG